MEWQVQKMCTDHGEYELMVEKQKASSHCEQRIDMWKWSVSYHGAVVAQGIDPKLEQAQALAAGNVPKS